MGVMGVGMNSGGGTGGREWISSWGRRVLKGLNGSGNA